MDVIKQIEQEQMRYDLPQFEAGDTVNVHVRIIEGTKERLQAFKGVVISTKMRNPPTPLLLFAKCLMAWA